METLAVLVARAIEAYLVAGGLFAIAFALRGARVLDPAAADGTRGFRLAIVPGAALLWPLLLARWLGGSPRPIERNAHRDRARDAE